MTQRTCQIEGCERAATSRGWCNMHWKRWYKHGDPMAGADFHGTPLERFLRKIEYDPATGCVLWTAGLDGHGYGSFGVGHGKTRKAHIFSWETWVGAVPPGTQLDHWCHGEAVRKGECAGGDTCVHRRCVDITHLEPVTSRENSQRSPLTVQSINAAKTTCKWGHPFDEANTNITSTGGRQCRTCNRERCRAWYLARHPA